jgi:hypothetical protein
MIMMRGAYWFCILANSGNSARAHVFAGSPKCPLTHGFFVHGILRFTSTQRVLMPRCRISAYHSLNAFIGSFYLIAKAAQRCHKAVNSGAQVKPSMPKTNSARFYCGDLLRPLWPDTHGGHRMALICHTAPWHVCAHG